MKRRAFTPQEDQRILDLFASGRNYDEIAELVGRSPSSIGGHLRALLRRAPALARVRIKKNVVPSVKAPRPRPPATTPPPAKPLPPPGDGWVRCLGGCGQMWDSPDRLRIRICPACKRSTNHNSGLSAAYALRL